MNWDSLSFLFATAGFSFICGFGFCAGLIAASVAFGPFRVKLGRIDVHVHTTTP